VQELQLSLVEYGGFSARAKRLDTANQTATSATTIAKFRFITIPPFFLLIVSRL